MDSTEKKPNYYVRTLIALFCALIVSMIAYRYVWVEPRGEISVGIITLLCLILILVLAESFDSFSVGKLISVSREVKKREREVEKLEKQNQQMLSQLVSISSNQAQTQSHTNVYGDYNAAPTVRKASEQEVREKQSNESAASISSASNESIRLRVNYRKVEELGLKKYIQSRSLHASNLIVDAKLVNQFTGIDPISNLQIVFDGYVREQDRETFVEIRPTSLGSPVFRDRLYVILSKINHYRTAKRVDAHLDLVLLKIPGEESRVFQSWDRILESFEPAVAGGLLKVVAIEFSEAEAASCREAT